MSTALRRAPVLPADSRLTSPTAFRQTTRSRRRAGARTLMTHLSMPDAPSPTAPRPPRVGFIVSKAVGSAVVRNRVKRRLRHAMRERIDALPAGSVLVVRAQAVAAGASYGELVADLDRCLDRVSERVAQ